MGLGDNPMDKHDVELRVQIRTRLLWDLMTTAVEGGIDYWGSVQDTTRDADLNVLKFTVVDREDEEDEEGKAYTVDAVKMLHGLQALLLQYPWRSRIVNEDYDAEDADCVVQMALFGEVMYG
jgi:hypothetical protein